MPNFSVFYSNPCTLWINASPLSLETVGISLRNLALSMTWGLSVSVFRRRDSRVEPWFPEALPRGLTYVPKYLTPISLIYTDLLFIWVICIYKKVMWNSSIAMLSQYQCESKPWSIACTVSPHRCHGPTGSPQACTEQMLEAVNGQFGTGQLHQSSFPLETCTGQHRFFSQERGMLKIIIL